MFSKKPLSPQPVADAPGFRGAERMAKVMANPYVAAGSAASLFLATALTLIAILGDPKAGAPEVRISLAKMAAMATPPGWREALSVESGGTIKLADDTYDLSATPIIVTRDVVGPTPEHLYSEADPLPQAPIAGLSAPGPGGPLPVIAPNGRTSAEAYARPFTSNGRPKVALVIGGLGLNAATTRQAIDTLPAQVTLSFVPYADGLQGWIDMARARGHEVLLEAPMEPMDYPDNDPGPYTLMAAAQPAETLHKLEWVLSRATGYFGVTNYLGSRFLASESAMASLGSALRSRGLAFIDDGQAGRRAAGPPRASAERIIDDQLSGEAIDQQLLALEAGALQHGQALGSGFAYPVTLSQVARWASAVETRGYQLAPASALTLRR